MSIISIQQLVIVTLFVFSICILGLAINSIRTAVKRKIIIEMNREMAKHNINGWVVLINVKQKIVGLYKDGHSVSHDKIFIGPELSGQIKTFQDNPDHGKFTLKDFQTLNVDVSKRSYRVLYEYQVPQETPVIFY